MTDTTPAELKNDLKIAVFGVACLIALALLGTDMTLVLNGKEIPQTLVGLTGTAFGFIFGAMQAILKD